MSPKIPVKEFRVEESFGCGGGLKIFCIKHTGLMNAFEPFQNEKFSLNLSFSDSFKFCFVGIVFFVEMNGLTSLLSLTSATSPAVKKLLGWKQVPIVHEPGQKSWGPDD